MPTRQYQRRARIAHGRIDRWAFDARKRRRRRLRILASVALILASGAFLFGWMGAFA